MSAIYGSWFQICVRDVLRFPDMCITVLKVIWCYLIFVEDKMGRLVYVATGMEANWEIPAPLVFNANMYSLLVVSKVWCSWLLCRSHPAAYMEQTIQKGCFPIFFLLHWSRENHPATLWRLIVMGVVTKGVESRPPSHTPFVCEIRLADCPASQATWCSIQALDGSYKSDIA